MTNSRISYDNAWENQDMITQILEMQQKVATGTYASVTASAGTGTDAGKIVFTFTDQEGTATVFKITAKTISSIASSQSGSTVTMTVTFNDGTTQTITWTAGGDVTTDTAQTISGTKTFTADQIFSGDVSFVDVVISGQAQIGDNLAVEDSGSDSVLSSGGAIKLTGSYATSTNRAYTDAGSSDVLVKAHVADMPVVHLTGNETVSGVKTFNGYINTLNPSKSTRVYDSSARPTGVTFAYRELCRIPCTNTTRCIIEVNGAVNGSSSLCYGKMMALVYSGNVPYVYWIEKHSKDSNGGILQHDAYYVVNDDSTFSIYLKMARYTGIDIYIRSAYNQSVKLNPSEITMAGIDLTPTDYLQDEVPTGFTVVPTMEY